MYIVMLALKKQKGYNLSSFLAAMEEVLVPVTMTSMVNAGMFAIMNVNVSHVGKFVFDREYIFNKSLETAFLASGYPCCLFDRSSCPDIRGLPLLDDRLLLSCLVLVRYATSEFGSTRYPFLQERDTSSRPGRYQKNALGKFFL
jgi:hypothetical protein